MTEKVVLTKEQAKAIEKFQKTVHELGISSDELKGIILCLAENRLDVNNND